MSFKDKETRIEDTLECVEALAKIVKDNDLGRIKISTDELDIVIEAKKSAPMPPMMPSMAMPAAPVVAAAPAAESAPAVESGNIVTSPIVGTFYAAPAPGKAPFVSVGSTVSKGDVLFIIESMKVMNEVTSEFDGRVAEILVKDGDAVEFD